MSCIKIVHFADYHLGIDTVGPIDPDTRLNGRVLDYLDILDSLIDYAIDNDADLALFAGDAFHKHNPDPTYIREFAERIMRLAEHCPIVLLTGNHDMPGVLEKASAIDIFGVFNVPNVYVGWQYEILDIVTRHGAVQVATVPYPSRKHILSVKDTHGRTVEQIDDIFKKHVSEIIAGLADKVDEDLPSVLLGHFSVSNALYGSERAITVGKDAEVSLEDLIVGPWDYVALGHLHYHQNLTENIPDAVPVIYPGSLERVDFGEENYNKGFVWVEISKDEVSWEFVEVDARPYRTIHINTVGKKDINTYIQSKISKMKIKGAVVRVIIDVDEENEVGVNASQMYAVIDKGGAYCVTTFNVRPVTRQRNDIRLGDVQVSSLSRDELLTLFFKSEGKTDTGISKLMDLAHEIFAEVDYDTGQGRQGSEEESRPRRRLQRIRGV
jgi:exonuclease SbcD